MPKCDNNPQSSAQLSVHTPKTNWHDHKDFKVEAQGKTEFEMWARLQQGMLKKLTEGNLRLMVGYWGDAMNSLPTNVRATIAAVIVKGMGLAIKPDPNNPEAIIVDLVERYQPLVPQGPQQTKEGLALPPESKLILPNDPSLQR